MIRLLYLSIALLCMGAALVRGRPGARAANQGEPIDAAIDAFIEQQMARSHLPGLALAVTRGGQVAYLKGYGSGPGQAAITPRTQFYLASTSKSFTALAVMQLVESGQIDLDAPVRQYLPEFTFREGGAQGAAAERVTVRHMLNHTSGLGDMGFQELSLPQARSPAERLRSLRAARPLVVPGEKFLYFNPNYEVLARLVEVVSGQPFSAYLAEHVFAPLGMSDTFHVNHSSEVAGQAGRLAQGHILAYGLPLAVDEMSGYIGGSAGVISTAQDLANYLIMQNQGGQFAGQALISAEAIEIMHTPPEGVDSNYGMGWMARQEDGRRIVEHNGILSAYYSEVVLLPDEQIGIVLLYNVNSLPATALAFPPIKQGLVDLLTGGTPRTGGFSVTHWGLLMALLTLVGVGQAGYSLARMPRWRCRAEGRPTWRLAPGILWALAPAAALAGMPWLASTGSGRFFGYAALLRSMPAVFVWLGACAALGLVNAALRLRWIVDRASGRSRADQRINHPGRSESAGSPQKTGC